MTAHDFMQGVMALGACVIAGGAVGFIIMVLFEDDDK